VVTSWVGLALSSVIDTSVLGVVFAHQWKRGLCPHALQILLSELTKSCELDLDCSRSAVLSLAHRLQFLVAKVLTALMGLPYQMMLQVVPLCWLTGDGFASWNWAAKSLAHEPIFSPNLTSVWTSLKHCCILALNFCCVFLVHVLPVLLHLTSWTAVDSCTCCCSHRHCFLQFCNCSAEVKSLGMEVKPTVSFLDRSPWKISLRLVNLWQDIDTLNHWRLNLSLMD